MNTFVVSDTHFGHANILTFVRKDGSRVRNFSSVEEMDEHMVAQWNSVVKPGDKVYHLGDVAMHGRFLPIVDRLNGTKNLIRGNHDMEDTKKYLKYFKQVYADRRLDGVILSHRPLHPIEVDAHKVNVHGHIHNNIIPELGPFYFNVSVEVINYTPVEWGDLKYRIRQQLTAAGIQ